MDRNIDVKPDPPVVAVALRKESVDRNGRTRTGTENLQVALRKESVDRNKLLVPFTEEHARSLSARRAWIEISVVKSEFKCV